MNVYKLITASSTPTSSKTSSSSIATSSSTLSTSSTSFSQTSSSSTAKSSSTLSTSTVSLSQTSPSSTDKSSSTLSTSTVSLSQTSSSSTDKSSSTLSTSTMSLSQTTPSATGTPTSGFYSLGCYAEPSYPTPKPWHQILFSENMSPDACISAAQAKLTANPPVTYRVLGLEYGRECWGQTAALPSQTSLIGNLACPSACAGDKSKSCGGNNMFNYYATTSGLGTSTAPVPVRTTGTVQATTSASTP